MKPVPPRIELSGTVSSVPTCTQQPRTGSSAHMHEVPDIVPCHLCGNPSCFPVTRLCLRCHELETRVEADPALAEKILRMQAALSVARANGGKLVRYPGGFWSKPGLSPRDGYSPGCFPEPWFQTDTVMALVERGTMRFSGQLRLGLFIEAELPGR